MTVRINYVSSFHQSHDDFHILYVMKKNRIDVNNSVSGLTIAKNVMNMIKKESCFEHFDMIVIVKARKKSFTESFGIL